MLQRPILAAGLMLLLTVVAAGQPEVSALGFVHAQIAKSRTVMTTAHFNRIDVSDRNVRIVRTATFVFFVYAL